MAKARIGGSLIAAMIGNYASTAYADDATLLQRLERQEQQIEAQDARIAELEALVRDFAGDRAPSRPEAAIAEPPATNDPITAAAPAASIPQSVPVEPAVEELPGETGYDFDPFATPATGAEYDPERAFFGPLPHLRSDDGGYSVGFSGLVQADAGFYVQDAQGGNATTQSLIPDFNSGTNVRRAVIGVNGTILEDFLYAFSYDFHDTGAAGVRAALVAYRGFDPLWLIVGQQGNAIGLEASTFAEQRSFMEASLQSAFAFGPGTPSIGIAALHRGSNHHLRLGIIGEQLATQGDSDEGWGIHGRAAWAPIAERTRALHIGASGYWRYPTTTRGAGNAGNSTLVDFGSALEVKVDERRFLDTGNISDIDHYYFGGLEAAAVYGPFSIQAEYGRAGIARSDGRLTDLDFDGYYVFGSYFLTGESRNYYPRFGTFWRVNPEEPFSLSKNQWGAWELLARFSHLDLNDGIGNVAGGGVRGGKANSYTIGLNWYMNAFVRMMLNYVHTESDKLSPVGLQEGDVVDAVGLRMQIEW